MWFSQPDPARDLPPPPRRVRWTFGGWFSLFAVPAVGALTLGAALFAAAGEWDVARLILLGATARGEVTAVEPVPKFPDRITYTFTPEGGAPRTGVDDPSWRSLEVGDPVEVVYLDAGAVSRIGPLSPFGGELMWMGWPAGVLALIATLGVGWILASLVLQRWWLAHGVGAPGVVIRVKDLLLSSDERNVRIEYRYEVGGERHEGSFNTSRKRVGRIANPGVALTVVYDPRRPHRSRPLVQLERFLRVEA